MRVHGRLGALGIGRASNVEPTNACEFDVTLELGTCLALAILILAGPCVVFFRHGARQTLAPWPIGPLRRLRDRTRRADIIDAAQAATLAGEPKFAAEMLGRYGLDLCPSCGQWTPLPSRMWGRTEEDHLTFARHSFVSVCHACHEAACPIGWECLQGPKYAETVHRIERRLDVRMYRAYERAQITMSRAQQRFDQLRAQFAKRAANFRRRIR